MSQKIFNYSAPYNNQIKRELKKQSNLVSEKRDLLLKNNTKLTQNDKKNIMNIDSIYRNIGRSIETLQRKKLNNFNENLDNYKGKIPENKLYYLLSKGNKILTRDIVMYEDNPSLPIREEAILLKYIVEELNIVDYAQVEKLDSIIRLILNTSNNKSLLKKRCDKILSLIR
jgi:hypothetical protein